MNVPNLIAKYANNVQRSASNVRKAVKKWQLKIKTFFEMGAVSFYGIALIFILSLILNLTRISANYARF